MKPAPVPHLPIEPLFDDIVRRCSGRRIDEQLSSSPNFNNADYLFEQANVIAELKEIQSDLSADEDLKLKLGEIHHKHRGRLGEFSGKINIRIDLLPQDIQNEMLLVLQRRLETPIKKAAKQIKETKSFLTIRDAGGLLILVNDNSTFLTPQLAHFFLSRILSRYHSSINHIIYCSVNMLLKNKEEPEGGRFWWSSTIRGRSRIPQKLTEDLQNTWMQTIDEYIGAPPHEDRVIRLSGTQDGQFVHPHHDANIFVRPGRFYRDKRTKAICYCIEIKSGSASMLILESDQLPRGFRAEVEQKLIYATLDFYQEITEKDEIIKLQAIVRKLRKST